MEIAISKILPNPDQPRVTFDQAELDALASSMVQHGLLNPISVEQAGDTYILIDGERRWRAAKSLNWTTIEASVRPAGQDRLVLALVGNIQRSEMNPIETARAFQRMVDAGITADQISKMVVLHAHQVRKYLQLLRLPEEIQDMIEDRRMPFETTGIAALVRIKNRDRQVQVAQAAVDRGLSGPGLARLVVRMGLDKHQDGDNHNNAKKTAQLSKSERVKLAGGRWNMIASLGYQPPDAFARAALKTCASCAIFPIASSANCRECPAVDLLRNLTDPAAAPEKKNGKVAAFAV